MKKKLFSGLIEIQVDPCVHTGILSKKKILVVGRWWFPPLPPCYHGNGMDLCIYTTEKKTGAHQARERKKEAEAPVRPVSVRQCSSSVPAEIQFPSHQIYFWKRNFAMKLFDVLIVVAIFFAAG
jgi:hypothetical protein